MSRPPVTVLAAATYVKVSRLQGPCREILLDLLDCLKKSAKNSGHYHEMRQCNAKAIQYWQDRLDKALSRAGTRCEQANQPEICKKRLDQSQTAWQDYVDMMAEYRMEVSGGGSEGLLEQGHFRAQAIRAQVRILE